MKKTKKPTPYIVMLALVVLLCLLCSIFCFQLLLIQGESMEPTFKAGQLCVINKFDRNYQAGDCILFYSEGPAQHLVKRVAATPGDIVEISDGKLFVNGKARIAAEDLGPDAGPVTVPEGCYFVLGDNLAHSIDSRHKEVGFVKLTDIKGKIIKAQA
jgi:signal peptidase I